MNKKLPNVFHNRNTGVIKNNIEKYYSKEENVSKNEGLPNENIRLIMIRKKINDLFNSSNFVYKVKAVITTSEGDKEYTFIAKNNDTLLTIDNKSILINEIIDIRKV